MTQNTAVVRGGQLIPDRPLMLPDGTRVRIEVDQPKTGRRIFFGMLSVESNPPVTDTDDEIRRIRAESNAHFEEELDEFFPRH